MKRFFPHPLLTFGLLSMWLLLNDSVEAAHVLLGLVMGMAGGILYARLEPSHGGLRKVAVPAVTLAGVVLWDIVRSNIAVLGIVLGARRRQRVSGFLSIPLALRDARGLAVLAGIVTATPGTSWAHYEAASNVLTLHVLDLDDAEAAVREFKGSYERRLMEIFG
jgi:multicomponent K+:H+ antiporter subunit E